MVLTTQKTSFKPSTLSFVLLIGATTTLDISFNTRMGWLLCEVPSHYPSPPATSPKSQLMVYCLSTLSPNQSGSLSTRVALQT